MSTKNPAALSDDADRPVFGDEAARWLGGRERALLPPAARPVAVRWTWAALGAVLLVLAGIAVLIGTGL